ncbi:hypothetical protein HPB51_017339 [Rhipicephalus microplus]|uniref:Annexin n=1 Tax=Rhipicephalus microplus TaxID=6941 RepID=A0A9J6EHH2_RHIMP|nr:hypothetical protein HPB51_017339 [Rhipicephalus microplus]
MDTSNTGGRGSNLPYPPPFPASSTSYPPGDIGSVPFVDAEGQQGASRPPPAGFVDLPSSSAAGPSPTMVPSLGDEYYPRSGVYPHRTPSLAMPGTGSPPLSSMPVAPPLPQGAPPFPGGPPSPHRAPSLPQMPMPVRLIPSASSTSLGYTTGAYPSSSSVPPHTSRPGYQLPVDGRYPTRGYSSSSRSAGCSTLRYGSADSGAPYASPSGGIIGYGASSGCYGGSQAGTSCYPPGRQFIFLIAATDHATVIEILCARSDDQRQEIVRFYKQSFGRDIVADVKSALRTNLEDIIVGLLYPLHEYLARELRKAIAGLGTDEECLIEILCTHSNQDIRLIKDHYQRIFQKDLERDVIGDTSGNFRRLLVSMCNELHRAGVLRWGTDVSAFNRIIAAQSYEQLRLVFREYNALANHTIIEAIKSEMSGDLRRAFLAIVKCVYYPPLYFAEKLHNSIRGLGTNDRVLKRVILSRCERDLELIKEEYLDKYKMTLSTAIQCARFLFLAYPELVYSDSYYGRAYANALVTSEDNKFESQKTKIFLSNIRC